MVAAEETRLLEAQGRVRAEMPDDALKRVHFHTPSTLFVFLDELEAEWVPAIKQPAADLCRTHAAERIATGPAIPLDPESMLDVEETSRYVRQARQTLAKLRSVGGGPPFYKIGKNIYYRRADLDEWLAARRHRSTSDTPTASA